MAKRIILMALTIIIAIVAIVAEMSLGILEGFFIMTFPFIMAAHNIGSQKRGLSRLFVTEMVFSIGLMVLCGKVSQYYTLAYFAFIPISFPLLIWVNEAGLKKLKRKPAAKSQQLIPKR